MDLTLANSKTNFDNLYPSIGSPFSNTNTHDILVIIGLITVCIVLFVLVIQFFLQVRKKYRTIDSKIQCKKSPRYPENYSSYQKLSDCKCFQYSCLPKFQCVKPTCQVSHQSSYYKQINEKQINNSICRVFASNHISSCTRIHTVK
ncbi:unnamed protein product [Adineta steineri]|uniref:Uncharacterized protein n=1 Tax=Adineta steineri TaxID=433720 RepID=A0A813SRK9_9BILA|nr:unnamed protein product [Adineta steineri]CAF1002981.1 unnamed protein product [Adineta steineri]CAF3537065.1 unnamed protein product [Adineta steineri]CAF3653289.1 unnamed protein product [Adineta steineri]